MRRILAAALILSMACFAVPAGAQSFDHSGLARRVLEQHIRPAYAALAEVAGRLETSLSSSCVSGGAAARTGLAGDFDAIVDAFGRIEHIGFGPVTRDSRLERLYFWPDRRDLGARQIARALETRDADVTSREKLAVKSVALQGLGALEIVLFGDGGPLGAKPGDVAHRCAYAVAIASNIAAIARETAAEWSEAGFGGAWLAPGSGSSPYLSARETTVELLKAFDRGVERTRDQRIAGPLGLNARRVVFPVAMKLSGRTMRLVAANIDGLLHLYRQGGMADAAAGAGALPGRLDIASTAKIVGDELETARALARSLQTERDPYADASRNRLLDMGLPLKGARARLSMLLAATAGVSLGLNATDGD